MEDFNKYKKQSEPEKIKKAKNWGVAIGLQQVDNMTISKYLIEVAKDNIEGKISIDEACEQISQYYKKIQLKHLRSIMRKRQTKFLHGLQNFFKHI